jgi:hypothetical protein
MAHLNDEATWLPDVLAQPWHSAETRRAIVFAIFNGKERVWGRLGPGSWLSALRYTKINPVRENPRRFHISP